MTSPISAGQPYSYYNVLNPTNPLNIPTQPLAPNQTPASSSPSTLPGGSGGVQLSAGVLNALQSLLGGGNADVSPISALLGGGSNNNGGGVLSLLGGSSGGNTGNILSLYGSPAGGVYQQVYAQALQAATSSAQQDVSNSGSQTVQNALAAYQSAVQAAHPNPVSTHTSA